MARKSKPKPDDPAQFKRFLDMAEVVEAEDDPKAVDRAFAKVMAPPKAAKKGGS